ncbi:MAG: HIT family protein [Candidatus Nanoarchaeia archaeon]
MSNEILVQDEEIIILTPKRAVSRGHIILTTVNEYTILEEVPPAIISKLFQIANKLSSILFDSLKCHGTNILIQNGLAAGQINSRFCLNIIPRYDKDSLKLDWTPSHVEPERLQQAQNKFQDVDSEEKEKKYIAEQKAKSEEKKKTEVISSGDDKRKRNYFVRSLERTA